MEKVKLPREVAEAIEYLKRQEVSNYGIVALSDQISLIGRDYSKEIIDALRVIRQFSFHNTDEDVEGEAGAELLLQALVQGYEVEPTAEEKMRQMLNKPPFEDLSLRDAFRCGVYRTLEAQGLIFKGVND